jgi:hypothetical protein|tara:strand:+ start:7000 stop:7629 length:630 start_codon:yes stop_codon:yes gene_type:complete
MKVLDTRDDYLDYVKTLLPQNPKVLEIGVEYGHFSEKILKVLQPSELHLLDPWEWNPGNGLVYQEGHMTGTPTAHSNVTMQINIERKYEAQISAGQIYVHRGYSHELVDTFDTAYFDFIYLDGCHLYESVKKDIEGYIKKVQPDGILGGHDYISQETKFVQQGVEYTNQLGYGIKQALDEFLEVNPQLELCALVSSDMPFPDWAIRRKS